MDTPQNQDPQPPEAPISECLVQLDLFESAQSIPVSYEILPAPLDELGAKGLPRRLNKSNRVVHVHAVQGNYSLAMRVLFNALLALSASKLSKMPAHTVDQTVAEQKVIRFEAYGSDIKKLIGWEHSGNYVGLYEMLDALMRLLVKWDVLATDGEQWSKNTTLLSQWERSADSGKIAWSWMPDLFGLIFDPSSAFTPLDLALGRKFNSKYTLALYENCFHYRKLPATPWRPTREWVLLIAGPDRYSDYREFKRTVLKTAIAELEATPDCSLLVELDEKHGRYNRVEQIRFKVRLKPQEPLELSLPASVNPLFLNQLKNLGLAESKIRQLLRDHDVAYLAAQLRHTLREATRTTIANPAGFFVRAVEDRYELDLAEAEVRTQEVLRQRQALDTPRKPAGAEHSDAKEALAWVASQTSDVYDTLLAQYLQEAPFAVRRGYERSGTQNKSVQAGWGRWLADQRKAQASAELSSPSENALSKPQSS